MRTSEMTEAELFEAMDGLMAYDHGATDSGIHDEQLRARVIAQVSALSPGERRVVLSRFVRSYLTDEMIIQGYGWEDARSAANWIDEQWASDDPITCADDVR